MKPHVLRIVSLLVLGVFLIPVGVAGQSEAEAEAEEKVSDSEGSDCPSSITVTILGSGTPVPSKTQVGSSILVEAAGEYFLFDCGRGCTTRLAQLDPQIIGKIHRLFITHLHSDHVVGIPDLWLNGWVFGRQEPLTTWGPEGTEDMMRHIGHAFSRDIAFRERDGVPASSSGLDPDFHELENQGREFNLDQGVAITAFPVDHGIVSPAYGYRVSYNGLSVLISGDTTETDNLYRYGKDTDILLLEVMSPTLISYLRENFAKKQVEKILRYHLTAEQAGKVLAKTEPKLGIYYHTRNEPGFASELIAETRSVYSGPLLVGHDLMQITVGECGLDVVDLTPTVNQP